MPISMYCQTMVGCYPFNGNADASGAGNNGVVNGAILTNDRFGASNSAYLFDGINDYIDLGAGYSYNSHSFSLWARRDSVGANQILSKINNGPYDTQNSELSITGFTIGTGSSWVSLNTSATGVNYSTWNHIVGTYNGATGAAKMYVNGFLDNTSAPSYVDVTSTPIYVGARPFWSGAGGTTFYFKGAIDDISIYDYEISQSMVDSIFAYNPLATGISVILKEEIKVYPTPGTGVFMFEGVNDPITVYDISGKIILVSSEKTIDISNQNAGMYFYKSGSRQGKILLFK